MKGPDERPRAAAPPRPALTSDRVPLPRPALTSDGVPPRPALTSDRVPPRLASLLSLGTHENLAAREVRCGIASALILGLPIRSPLAQVRYGARRTEFEPRGYGVRRTGYGARGTAHGVRRTGYGATALRRYGATALRRYGATALRLTALRLRAFGA